jgi:colicin import membrane protein
MSTQSAGPYALSALIHAAVFGLILFFGYAANRVVQDAPKVFELVAGAGDNYAATAAPALGSPTGIKIKAEAPSPVQPAPAQPAPPMPRQESSPIQSAPVERAPAKPAKPVDLVAELKRVEARREKRLEAKYKKEEDAEKKRMTQEEFQKEQQAKASRASRIDAEGIREGVIGGSTENKKGGASGKALTREEGSELEAYFALLKARIKENHVPPEGVSDSLVAVVEFFVAADGSLSHVRISRSSGNAEFDRSVVEACQHTPSVGARPDGRSETVEMTFKMRDEESQ